METQFLGSQRWTILAFSFYVILVLGPTDVSDVYRRFYGQFNNIMSVLGKQSNEMSAVHLVKPYCLPTQMYGCEAWTLTDGSLRKLNTAWNNCFRRIFLCCWRKNRAFCSSSVNRYHFYPNVTTLRSGLCCRKSVWRLTSVVCLSVCRL